MSDRVAALAERVLGSRGGRCELAGRKHVRPVASQLFWPAAGAEFRVVDVLEGFDAEKHILKALPGMVKKAGSRKLKEALETHRKETEGQVDRLDQVFKLFDIAPRGKKCEAIEGILTAVSSPTPKKNPHGGK